MRKQVVLLCAAILFFVSCNMNVPENGKEEKIVEGVVINASADVLQMKTSEAVELDFEIEKLDLTDVEGLIAGQDIWVYYTGEINGTSTADATVTHIIDPTVSHIEGKIVDATMNTLTIQAESGEALSFSTMDADMSAADGLVIGNTVKVYYAGEIDGSNTADVTVLKVTMRGEKSIVGTVADATMNTIVLQLDNGELLQFGTEDADKSGLQELLIGDRITIVYTGIIYGTSTEDVMVIRLASPVVYTVEGEIVDAAMNSILIRTDDGRELSFMTENADKSEVDGLLIGSRVVVYYTGELVGENTDKVMVIKLKQTT